MAPILDQTQIFWICGNHDADREQYYDNLFESNLRGQNIQDHGIATVAGIRIAGIGGVFREKVWDGSPLSNRGDITSPEQFARNCGAGNRWRGSVPLRHRATVFPSHVDALRGKHADVLVTHEAPDLHPNGNAAFMRLASALGVKWAVHGHHQEMISYPGGIWRGVSVCGIVALDTDTFEITEIDPGLVSNRQEREREKLKSK